MGNRQKFPVSQALTGEQHLLDALSALDGKLMTGRDRDVTITKKVILILLLNSSDSVSDWVEGYIICDKRDGEGICIFRT